MSNRNKKSVRIGQVATIRIAVLAEDEGEASDGLNMLLTEHMEKYLRETPWFQDTPFLLDWEFVPKQEAGQAPCLIPESLWQKVEVPPKEEYEEGSIFSQIEKK